MPVKSGPAQAANPLIAENAMNEPRYGVRQERNGTWTVIDLITRLPAASDGRDLAGLDEEDARDIMNMLNRAYLARRRSPLV